MLKLGLQILDRVFDSLCQCISGYWHTKTLARGLPKFLNIRENSGFKMYCSSQEFSVMIGTHVGLILSVFHELECRFHPTTA